jgi:hypothetical protein
MICSYCKYFDYILFLQNTPISCIYLIIFTFFLIYLIYLTSLSYQSLYALSLLTKSGLNAVVLALLFVKLLGPIELHTRHYQTVLTVQYQRSKLVKQWLSVGEGDALRDWMLELASWGWPVRVEQLRSMATELLVEKGDTKELGVHWAEQYIT